MGRVRHYVSQTNAGYPAAPVTVMFLLSYLKLQGPMRFVYFESQLGLIAECFPTGIWLGVRNQQILIRFYCASHTPTYKVIYTVILLPQGLALFLTSKPNPNPIHQNYMYMYPHRRVPSCYRGSCVVLQVTKLLYIQSLAPLWYMRHASDYL